MEDALSYVSESLEKADKVINKLGLPLPQKPEGEEITWPKNVGDLSMEELAEHMTWWRGWSAYCSYHLSRAESNKVALEAEYKTEFDSRIFKSSGDYDKVTEQKAAIGQAPDMVKRKKRVLEVSAVVKVLNSLFSGYDGKYEVISREVSRRHVEGPSRADKGVEYSDGRGC